MALGSFWLLYIKQYFFFIFFFFFESEFCWEFGSCKEINLGIETLSAKGRKRLGYGN